MKQSYTLILFLFIVANPLNGQIKEVVPSHRTLPSISHFNGAMSIPSAKKIIADPFHLKPMFQSNQLQGQLNIEYLSRDGAQAWFNGQSKNHLHLRSASDKDKLEDYLNEIYLRIDQYNIPYQLHLIEKTVDELGIQHYKTKLAIDGIPIENSEGYFHGKDQISAFNGSLFLGLSIHHNTVLSADQAISIAETHLKISDSNYFHDSYTDLTLAPAVNEIYYKEENYLRRGYKLSIHENVLNHYEMIVDASSGELVSKVLTTCHFHPHKIPNDELFNGPAVANANDLFGFNNEINTYDSDNFYFLIDASRAMFDGINSMMPNNPVGVIWTIDAFDTSPETEDFKYGHVASTDNTWVGSENAVSAHVNAGKAYEYFKNTHGRESINGLGGNIISLINITDKDGASMENAFWNGVAMFYGSGGNSFQPLARGLDVAAHELAHGVVQNTANLAYQGESGALNESFADIFGAMVDRDDWKIGEDVIRANAFPSGALRDLQDPHNGAASGQYGAGFQPKHVDEQFRGTGDNGGVHINSGIPNHAFYLFATAIGKEKAEQIFYRALAHYLLKSSQFLDLRIAVKKAADDLDSDQDGLERRAAESAFDQVGIMDGEGGDFLQDLNDNQGNEFLLAVSEDKSSLILYNSDIQPLFNIYNQGIFSKPSVTDDGRAAIFVGNDKRIYVVLFNWTTTGVPTIGALDSRNIWRNAIVSKDGNRIAALYDDQTNRIYVEDLPSQSASEFSLYNPTFTEGIITDNVDFADAMEFDFSGDFIIYDAQSSIESQGAATINFWDIGFLQIWNSAADTWSLGNIEKLFTSLPEGVSVGNPTLAKNSPYILSFDQFKPQVWYRLMGANIETGELNVIAENSFLNFPNYKNEDKAMVVDVRSNTGYDLVGLEVDDSKITLVPNSPSLLLANHRWGVWFANGNRSLSTSTDDIERISILSAFPNPTNSELQLRFNLEDSAPGAIEVFGLNGQLQFQRKHLFLSGKNEHQISVNGLPNGTYLLRVITDHNIGSILFVKQ